MEGNVHVLQILVELVLKAKCCHDHSQLNTEIEQAEARIARAVKAKDVLLNSAEVTAIYPFLSERRLQNLRYRGGGPKYYKFGQARNSRVFYKPQDVEVWILDNRQLTPYVEGLNLKPEDLHSDPASSYRS